MRSSAVQKHEGQISNFFFLISAFRERLQVRQTGTIILQKAFIVHYNERLQPFQSNRSKIINTEISYDNHNTALWKDNFSLDNKIKYDIFCSFISS